MHEPAGPSDPVGAPEPPEGPASFAGFLSASLAAIRRETPASARAIAAALGATTIALVVDGEPLIVRPGPEVVVGSCARELARTRPPQVHVATTARALLALLDGEDELYPAVVANRVRVRAAPRDAERLFDALRSFVEGCARTSSAPGLLAGYRRRAGGDHARATTREDTPGDTLGDALGDALGDTPGDTHRGTHRRVHRRPT
jgi:hypothetical protein